VRNLLLLGLLLVRQDGEEIVLRFKYSEGDKERYSIDTRESVKLSIKEGRQESKRAWADTWSSTLKVHCTKAEEEKFHITVSSVNFQLKSEEDVNGDLWTFEMKEGAAKMTSKKQGVIFDTNRKQDEKAGKKFLERFGFWDIKEEKEDVLLHPQGVITPNIDEMFEGTVGDTLFPILLPPDGVCVGDEWARTMSVHDVGPLYLAKGQEAKVKYKIEKFEGKGFKREAAISLTYDLEIADCDAELMDYRDTEPVKVRITKLKQHVSIWNRVGVETGKLNSTTLDALITGEFKATDPRTKKEATVKIETTVSGTMLPER